MYDLEGQAQASGLTFRQLAIIGRRQWWVVLGCVLLAAAGSAGYVKAKAVSYAAPAQVDVATPPYASAAGASRSAAVSTTALLTGALSPTTEVTATSVTRAAQAAAHVSRTDLRLRVTLSSDQSSVYVTATAPGARQAVAAANAAATAFEARRSRDLSSALSQLAPEISSVEKRISALGPRAATRGGAITDEYNADLVQLQQAIADREALVVAQGDLRVGIPATPATVTANRTTKKVIEVALLAGLLAGLGIALAREQFDDKIRSAAEIAEISPTEVLAQIPRSDLGARSVTIADNPFGETAEAVRELRTALRFLSVKRPIRTVLVTSAGNGEGKSFVAANLAAAWAMSGVRTILVSSDLRRPSLERLFSIEHPRRGLSEAIVDAALSEHDRSTTGFSYLDEPVGVLSVASPSETEKDALGIGEFDVDDLLVPTGVEGLMLLPAGPSPPNPAELLGSPELAKLMVSLRERAEVVVLDSPPVMAVTDPLVLTAHADGVVFVVSANRTSRASAQQSLRLLESGLAPLLGVVINRSSRSQGVAHY